MTRGIFVFFLVLSALTYLSSAEPGGTCPEVDPETYTVYLVDLDDCGAFYACSGGYADHMHCADTTYWNPKSEYCVKGAEAAECGSRPVPQTQQLLN